MDEGDRAEFSVADVETANFNEIYDALFNYLENNPVGIAYRERIVFFEISFQPMGLEPLVENVFSKDCKSLSQTVSLFIRKPLKILLPVFFEGTVKMN